MTWVDLVGGIIGGLVALCGLGAAIIHAIVIIYRSVNVLQETVEGVRDLTEQFVRHVATHDEKYAGKHDLERLSDRVDRLSEIMAHLTQWSPLGVPNPRKDVMS